MNLSVNRSSLLAGFFVASSEQQVLGGDGDDTNSGFVGLKPIKAEKACESPSPYPHLPHSLVPSSSVESTVVAETVATDATAAKPRSRLHVQGQTPKTGRQPTTACSARPAKKQCRTAAALHEAQDDDDDEELCGGAGGGGRKGPISHSTVEKQRRDRINTLIDLLAEQVPPPSTKYSLTHSGGVRRPKHVVLSDTLSLLAKLRLALKIQEEQIAKLTGTGGAAAPVSVPLQAAPTDSSDLSLAVPSLVPEQARCPLAVKDADPPHYLCNVFVKEEELQPCTALPLHLHPALDLSTIHLPQAADNLPLDPDVVVAEVAPGRFTVSIKCLHKPDIHMDVVEGLSNLPVSIDHIAFSCPDVKEGVTRGSLQLSSLPGAVVVCEQLHLALYMSVCWSCPQLQLDGMELQLQDAEGPWAVVVQGQMHTSSSYDSMDSWY